MKKSFKAKVATFMMVLVLALSFAGCGGGKSKAIGSYKLETIEAEGMTINMEDLLSLAAGAGVEGVDEDTALTLEIKEDGKFVLDMTAFDESMSEEGTWEEKDGKLTLTADEVPVEASLDGDTITIEEYGSKMVFKKK